MRYVVCTAIALICTNLGAQTPPAKPQFEVASVKPSPPPGPGWRTVGCKGGPGTSDPGLFTCTNANIHFLVTMAFKLNEYEYQFPGRDDADYEISAKVPLGATREQFDRMLQSLLVERFNLTYNHEAKQMSVYDLVISKGGIKMNESPPEAEAPTDADTSDAAETSAPRKQALGADGFPAVPPPRPGHISYSMLSGRARWATINTTMQNLAGFLSFQLLHPVNDATGLSTKYDFTLSWVSDGRESTALSATFSGPTLLEAVQQQLGLKLEQKKGPVDIFIIDHVEKPSEN